MSEQPEAVLKHLEQAMLRGHRIVISAITCSEMRFAATGPKASLRLLDAESRCGGCDHGEFGVAQNALMGQRSFTDGLSIDEVFKLR
ncbi:plasmid maintenance protein [Escherichia coli]|nr:plasmid maintenance protein [Escherichia coli]GCJ14581.1 plasmid maintenance protein [Escherichia coli]GCJ45213.1 plasmid maintenance protein [Escherichia coli]